MHVPDVEEHVQEAVVLVALALVLGVLEVNKEV